MGSVRWRGRGDSNPQHPDRQSGWRIGTSWWEGWHQDGGDANCPHLLDPFHPLVEMAVCIEAGVAAADAGKAGWASSPGASTSRNAAFTENALGAWSM